MDRWEWRALACSGARGVALIALVMAGLTARPAAEEGKSAGQGGTMVIRPAPIEDVLVNPGMGIQTFQRFDGQAPYPTLEWSEAGPEGRLSTAPSRPDFPASSVAYLRWFWSQVEPEPGHYRWEVIDLALQEARRAGQTLAIRVMPYDDRHPLPEWYRNSGARRVNAPSDADGGIWSPDAADPLYARHWGALVRALGARYDGNPDLDAVDISTVGYWGEGWGPHLPDWPVQRALIDVYFKAFRRTPLLVNFGSLRALEYAVRKGAGWRLDCWGDLGGHVEEGFSHMLDRYPQWVIRAGIQEAWRRRPVSLETCGTPGHWRRRGYGARELREIMDQALRWHASTINIKSTVIPPEWREAFDDFQRRIGYRFVLRRFEMPRSARAGQAFPVSMLWLNAGVAPVYRAYTLALQLSPATAFSPATVSFPAGEAVIPLDADVRGWLPGDFLVEGVPRLPESLKPGEYRVRVGLLDPRTGKPAIRLAIEGRQPDGWYDLGMVRVAGADPSQSQAPPAPPAPVTRP